MSLLTTTIGAFPKPDYVPTPDWFRGGMESPTAAYSAYLKNLPEDIDELLDRATQEVVRLQAELGIDIPTDGEIRREDYINYQCRNFAGFDFENLTHQVLRNGAWEAHVATVRDPIKAGEPILPADYQVAQAATTNPVKITLPGPLTIAGSTADDFYHDKAALGWDLAVALNHEILALAEAGCTWIQVDEPVFARNPDLALDFGFRNLERCFKDVPEQVNKAVHMCCGYPMHLDHDDYEKADRNVYLDLAPAIDESIIDAISLEDAHAHNDLTLLEKFSKTKVIWGSVAIAKSEIESVETIKERLKEALNHIDAERLIVAPDCGLGFLTHEMVMAKLGNMAEAAHSLG